MSKSFYNLVLLISATKTALCLPAILLNFSLIYVTFKSKFLRKGLCNWLLAIYDGCLIVYLATFPLALFQHLLTINDLMPFWKCFLLQAIPLTLFAASFPVMFSIALDRFIGAAFPYPSLNNPYYFGSVFFGCACYSALYLSIALGNLFHYSESSMSCSMINLLLDYQQIMAMTNILLEAMAIILYVVIVILLSKKKNIVKKLNETSFDRRILKSLFTIASLDFIGWTSNSSAMILLGILNIDDETYYKVLSCISYLTFISACSNAPLLYYFSHSYRQAFNKHFPFTKSTKNILFRRKNVKIAATPLNN